MEYHFKKTMKEVINMFLFTNKLFKYSYFLSSLLPLNSLMILWFTLVEDNKNTLCFRFIAISFISIGAIQIISLVCLISQISKLKNFTRHQGKEVIYIKNKYNSGVRDFLLSTFLPILTSFSFKDNVIAAFIMVLIFQLCLFVFYLKSSDFMPNIILILLGYNVFEGSINNGKTVYCISKGIEIGTLIENKRMGIKIGNATKVGNVYWIVED